MNAARLRLFDRIAASISPGILLVALGSVAYLCLPADPWTAPAVNLEPGQDAVSQKHRTLELSDLAAIWQRDLRQPVVDPPAEKPQQRKKVERLAIQLLGTAVEADQQYGIFRLSNNRTVVRAVGEEVEGFEVIQISRGRARLRNGQRECKLTVPWLERIAAGGTEQDDG